jgi:NitT/TauT family transport system substrate-binding protein
VVERLLRAHVKVTRFILENEDEAKRLVNEGIEELTTAAIPQAVLDGAWEKQETTYDPIASSLRQSADAAFELGFLGARKPDLSGIYDLSILNKVLRELNLPLVEE